MLSFDITDIFLSGVISLLADIRSNNDLGHPLCANLRQGNWLIGNVYSIILKIDFQYSNMYYIIFEL